MNAFVHPYLAFHVVLISLKSKNPLFVNYFHTDIHFGSSIYKYWMSQLTRDICIVLYFY